MTASKANVAVGIPPAQVSEQADQPAFSSLIQCTSSAGIIVDVFLLRYFKTTPPLDDPLYTNYKQQGNYLSAAEFVSLSIWWCRLNLFVRFDEFINWFQPSLLLKRYVANDEKTKYGMFNSSKGKDVILYQEWERFFSGSTDWEKLSFILFAVYCVHSRSLKPFSTSTRLDQKVSFWILYCCNN